MRFLGVLLIIIAVAGGLYVGGYLCLAKGIYDGIHSIAANDLATTAINVLKVFVAAPAVEAVAWLIGTAGLGLIALGD